MSDGRTPVWTAALNGHLEVVKFLQSSGCKLEPARNNGATLEYIAAETHLEVVNFLHSSGRLRKVPTARVSSMLCPIAEDHRTCLLPRCPEALGHQRCSCRVQLAPAFLQNLALVSPGAGSGQSGW